MTAVESIPYEAIDAEIRPLVRLLNEQPGIETLFSCAGHADGEEGYVSFVAACQCALRRVIAALPFTGQRSALVANRFEWQTLVVDATIDDTGRLAYALRLAGGPFYMQRRLIEQVERSLTSASRSPAERHPSCPTCAFGSRRGT